MHDRFGILVEDVSKNYIENDFRFYSQAGQDFFALGCSDYKNNGIYCDIGCSGPREANNTWLLEKVGWKGINLDIRAFENYWKETRKDPFIGTDATKCDYNSIFSENDIGKEIDYLSIDVDQQSVKVLERIPFDTHTFNVITIEHDLYADGDKLKKEQIKILEKNNYFLLAENVCLYDKGIKNPYEDWWVSEKILLKLGMRFHSKYYYEILNRLDFCQDRKVLIDSKENLNNLKSK